MPDFGRSAFRNARLEAIKRQHAIARLPHEFGMSMGGGGGLRLQRLRVKSQSNDYLTCRTWNGTTEGSTDIPVAKPFKLRHVAANYTGVSALSTVSASSVEVTISGVAYTWVIPGELDYQVDNEIYAVAAASGVRTDPEDAATEIGRLDINIDGRAWAEDES